MIEVQLIHRPVSAATPASHADSLPYAAAQSRRPGRPKKWEDAVIEAGLRQFVAQMGRWPARSDFLSAGRGDLLQAMRKNGGTAAWAARLGGEGFRPRGGRAWTDERIEAALRRFLTGRAKWPAEREFAAAGLGDLHAALRRHGGQTVWARRMGLRADTAPRQTAS